MKVGFNVKFGYNEIEIPVSEGKQLYPLNASGLSNLHRETFTIINQIPQSASIATKTAWKKHILTKCGKQNGLYDKSSGTMIYRANSWTAYIFDWQGYKQPNWLDGGYYMLSDEEKDNYFTANVGDLLIFGEIPDAAPTTIQEFNALATKYKDNGGIITGNEVYINYKPDGTPWKMNHIELIKG